MGSVHIAVTRPVKPGAEKEFEAALREFARESLHEPGATGIHLITPVPGANGCEFGILRSFDSEESSRAFYESERFARWQEQVAPLVAGDGKRRRLTGLEAFFRDAHFVPPRWKMAIVTWLGVFPTVLLWSNLLPPFLQGLPYLLVSAIINVFVVVTLAWGVMPLLTRLLSFWLRS